MRVVLERCYNDLRLLNVSSKTLKTEGFFRSNKVRTLVFNLFTSCICGVQCCVVKAVGICVEFLVDDCHCVPCGMFFTSKYCALKYCRLFVKPGVRNRVEQDQMWLILSGSNDGRINKLKSSLLRGQSLAYYCGA